MAATRVRIMTATNELFRRAGYHGTSLKQISKAAEAPIGSIYHFFPGGKDQLTAAVIESTADVYRGLFEAIMADAADIVAGFADFFEVAAEVVADSDYIDPCPIGTVAREIASTNPELRAVAERAFAGWIEAADRHLRLAGIGESDAADLATIFVAIVEGSFVLSRTQRSGEPLLAAARQVTRLVSAARTSVAPSHSV